MMFKILLLLVGVGAGAGGATAYLLSPPDSSSSPALPASPGNRVQMVKQRLLLALEEGKRAGAATENQLRHQLDAYRLHPDRPGTS